MASLIKKTKKGHDYWYVVESARVDGRPRIVYQKYLGTVENILRTFEGRNSERSVEADVHEFGGIAALLGIADDYGVLDTFGKICPKREQGVSVGHYMLLAAINRVLAPGSKERIGEWYAKTALARIWKIPQSAFSSKRFWDAMDRLDDEQIHAIEEELVSKLVTKENIDLESILYDTTNFATHVSSNNDRNSICQRGKSKKKRSDLRLVGFALLASRDFGIPLFHETYAGNLNDPTQFRSSILAIVERYQRLCGKDKNSITLTFDKGNTGKENFVLLDHYGLHFVSSLRRDQCSDLLDIEASAFEEVNDNELPGVRAHRCIREVHGTERTVIVTLSDSYFSKEASALNADLAKAIEKLAAEVAWVRKASDGKSPGPKPTLEQVRKRVSDILENHRMEMFVTPRVKRSIIDVTISPTEDGGVDLNFHVNYDALDEKIKRHCGKTILFTSRGEWDTGKIIKAYRSQADIEDIFKNMNDRDYLRWQPAFHWTDQKIKVHSFYCTLALFLAGIARRRAAAAGVSLSMHEFLEQLAAIKEVLLLQAPEKAPAPPRIRRVYSRMEAPQKRLHDALGLNRYRITEG